MGSGTSNEKKLLTDFNKLKATKLNVDQLHNLIIKYSSEIIQHYTEEGYTSEEICERINYFTMLPFTTGMPTRILGQVAYQIGILPKNKELFQVSKREICNAFRQFMFKKTKIIYAIANGVNPCWMENNNFWTILTTQLDKYRLTPKDQITLYNQFQNFDVYLNKQYNTLYALLQKIYNAQTVAELNTLSNSASSILNQLQIECGKYYNGAMAFLKTHTY